MSEDRPSAPRTLTGMAREANLFVADPPIFAQFPRTIEQMTDYIEALVPVWPEVGTSAVAPTGEPYITFTIGGSVEELERPELVATKEAAACKWFLDSFLRYALEHRGTLYWREKPNLQIMEVVPSSERGKVLPEDARTYYQIWARLLMSDKPVLEKAE